MSHLNVSKRVIAAAVVLGVLPVLPAMAQQATPPVSAPIYAPGGSSPIVPRTGFGGETDTWLSLQLNPSYTANDTRPIPGEVASRTYLRYLDSFSHPIPEQFGRQGFVSGGGSAP